MRRGCPYYAMTTAGDHVESGWLATPASAPDDLHRVIERLGATHSASVAVGIDAPRAPLDARRMWSWSGKSGTWSPSPAAVGAGRHCEVVISAQRLANPQWTPMRDAAPEWMRLGFELFARLREWPHVYEVFPSAAYTQLARDSGATLTLSVTGLLPGPKDMLDAAIGALVVRDFLAGRGCAVGGGDGLGTIILPRSLDAPHAQLTRWPSSPESDAS